jgi:hypothetical protein
MERDSTLGRQRLLDREPGKLVPETNVVLAGNQHPRGEAFVEAAGAVPDERVEQPQGRPRRRDGDCVERGSSGPGQSRGAREHCVLDRRRNRVVARREHLGDEERVSAGQAVELRRVDSCRLRQLGHGLGRKRLHDHAAGRRDRRAIRS